jgi:hypothetical protein
MNLATFDDLRPLVEVEKMDAELLAETFRILNYGHHYLWIDKEEIEQKATQYALQQGWDPDTTLVLYSLPTLTQEYVPDPDREIDLDDFDIQIGSVNPNQAVCTLYPNLTVEKLADTINRISRMRVFL